MFSKPIISDKLIIELQLLLRLNLIETMEQEPGVTDEK